MPRGPRLDAPGALHHVRFRGIERRKLFLDDQDRREFLERLDTGCEDGKAFVYAWCLMGNHVHLAIRTGSRPLARTMSSVLTGFASAFNRRHRRSGHLLQNRYKSTIVEEERYFLALVRYIHLNPLRARIVGGLEDLKSYPWTGHGALMGGRSWSFQDTDEVLTRFGTHVRTARRELMKFMMEPGARQESKVFRGASGGLRRSMEGVEELREGRRGPKWAHDDRVLGGGRFVTSILEQASKEFEAHVMSEEKRWSAYEELVERACRLGEVGRGELLSGSRRRAVVQVRQVVAYLATRELGLPGAAVARSMNVSPPAIAQASAKGPDALERFGWKTEELVRRGARLV